MAPARSGNGWNAAWSAVERTSGGAGSGWRDASTGAGGGGAAQAPALTVVVALASVGIKTTYPVVPPTQMLASSPPVTWLVSTVLAWLAYGPAASKVVKSAFGAVRVNSSAQAGCLKAY